MKVAVVGAGIAGLSTAVRLHRAGCEVTVHDAADRVGGRVATDTVDGLTLDRGFQVYNPAYTEGRGLLDLSGLGFRPLSRGLLLRLADERALVPWHPAQTARLLGRLGPRDAVRLASYLAGLLPGPPGQLRRRPDVSIRAALMAAGVSEWTVATLLAPFLRGVVLEGDLTTSRLFGDEVLRSFLVGSPGVPIGGMGRLAAALADQLPSGAIRLRSPVADLDAVRGDRGGRPAAIVVATDVDNASRLLPGAVAPGTWHSVTTWYHTASSPGGPDPRTQITHGRGVLVVDGRTGAEAGASQQFPGISGTIAAHAAEEAPRIVNAVAISQAVAEYAPGGRTLIATSALGVHPSPGAERAVRTALADLLGTDTREWQHIATYPIAHAVPAMPVPMPVPRDPRIAADVYLAGDYCDTSSLQGAMRSGRRAAAAVLATARLRRVM
ncbi:MAG: FAD-dependent oxidoreductase [Actinomycetales bacterium]|nr:FAD-dependent oxidoreductase [Actinomycetales bacterium]